MTDFVHAPSSIEESASFEVDNIQFGDGYKVRIPVGINNGLRKWSVSFTDKSLADAEAMVNFWRGLYGSTSFSWRPKGYSADVRVICQSYSKPIQNRYLDGAFVYSVSAMFEEVAL